MTKDTVKKYTLYKLRFWLGYSFLGLVVLCVFGLAAMYSPGGLTAAERQSALTSASLQLSEPASLLIVDLPYHVLQKASLYLFDLTAISVKLPSLLIGFITAIALVLLLRKRFTQTASIITAGVIVISAQFISLVATGAPDIMMVLWPTLLLLIAVYTSHSKQLPPMAIYTGGAVIALSLFTPFTLYVVAAFILAALIHPRTRYMLRKAPRGALFTALGAIILAVGICVYASYRDHTFAERLLFRSSSFSLDILANLRLILAQIIDFTSMSTAQTSLLAPVFGLSTIVFVILGIYHLLKWRFSALSYVVTIWMLALVPIIVLNPSMLYLLIPPFALLVASGVGALLGYWYRLFPKNPYARVFALVPVTILFACIIISGAARYFYSFHYYAPLANASSHDLELVDREVTKDPHITLFVAKDEESFYQLYLDTHNNSTTHLSSDTASVLVKNQITQNTLATRGSTLVATGVRPSRVIATSELTSPSDRLYIYRKTAE